MSHLRNLYLAVLVACLYFPTASVLAAENDLLREMQDRKEIEDLLWRYVRALDTYNPEAYASLYTDDGQFGNIRGKPALMEMINDLRIAEEDAVNDGEEVPPRMHMIANSMLEFEDRDHVRHHAYWLIIDGATDTNPQARLISAGRSIDELVRVNGEWKIQFRNIAYDEQP